MLISDKTQPRPKLSRQTALMPDKNRPVRIVQFGGGVFLRGFADWMIDSLNRRGLFNGSVALVQSVSRHRAGLLENQDGLYTVRLRGPQQAAIIDTCQIIDVLSAWLSPQDNLSAYLKLAENPDWRYMISNTTENGIVWHDGDYPDQQAADSFPGRLTQLLYHRYCTFAADPDRGIVCLPCELIPENGTRLLRYVLRHAARWKLPPGFSDWVNQACVFHNTLVDRIVTGFPANPQAAEAAFCHLGYDDQLYVEAEPYHLWVIEGQEDPGLPLREAGLNVLWTDHLTPWRELKVRILNGAHMILLPIACCRNDQLVRQSLLDPDMLLFLETALRQAVLPYVRLDGDVVSNYADTVLARFSNPALDHQWSAISLHTLAKFRVRLIPSLQDAAAAGIAVSAHLCFTLAALIRLYRGDQIPLNDDPQVIQTFAAAWESIGGQQDPAVLQKTVRQLFSDQTLWGCDLDQIPGITSLTAIQLSDQLRLGMRKAVRQFVQSYRSTSQ